MFAAHFSETYLKLLLFVLIKSGYKPCVESIFILYQIDSVQGCHEDSMQRQCCARHRDYENILRQKLQTIQGRITAIVVCLETWMEVNSLVRSDNRTLLKRPKL